MALPSWKKAEQIDSSASVIDISANLLIKKCNTHSSHTGCKLLWDGICFEICTLFPFYLCLRSNWPPEFWCFRNSLRRDDWIVLASYSRDNSRVFGILDSHWRIWRLRALRGTLSPICRYNFHQNSDENFQDGEFSLIWQLCEILNEMDQINNQIMNWSKNFVPELKQHSAVYPFAAFGVLFLTQMR